MPFNVVEWPFYPLLLTGESILPTVLFYATCNYPRGARPKSEQGMHAQYIPGFRQEELASRQQKAMSDLESMRSGVEQRLIAAVVDRDALIRRSCVDPNQWFAVNAALREANAAVACLPPKLVAASNKSNGAASTTGFHMPDVLVNPPLPPYAA